MDNMNNTNTGNNAVDSSRHTQEIVLDKNRNGLPVMIAVIAAYAAAVVLLFGSTIMGRPLMALLAILWLCFGWILFLGLKVLGPQEARC